jgi:hypothetical protein
MVTTPFLCSGSLNLSAGDDSAASSSPGTAAVKSQFGVRHAAVEAWIIPQQDP